ncbi:MAG TPA: DUF554 domain-containing protein [Candidatus Bilophila faecipullorum]|mgnify:CR=1 FL=1|uniref:DUF554 domain-containing protein n=1 Tax=Candidatus Bilophila faecipullorum TaxID=2838482 RepID=A0A9D1R0U8_9BACT|nr:DUF554 domain-containing protein [uncultured Bilophila sp.]HIW78428.1 DUF554 domain-containing protein [Candidatus Bilophila faecipullorum]
MIPVGAFVNAVGIALGSLVGVAFGSRLPERIRTIVFQGLGLCTLVLGLKMALPSQQPLIVIFSIVIGSAAGEALKLESRLMRVGDILKARLRSSNPLFTDGMVNASVLFCIGAMAIVGSFDEGIRGDRAVVFSKTLIDSFAALALASAYGIGVLFSALPVLIYQGSLTVLAGTFQQWLDPATMTELTAVGGTLIIGIALNMLEVTRIALSNMLPSLLAVIGLCALAAQLP